MTHPAPGAPAIVVSTEAPGAVGAVMKETNTMMDAKKLIGRTIQRIFVSDDQQYLKFQTDKGWIALRAEADCCSETWFADVFNSRYVVGKKISKIDEIDVPPWVSVYADRDGRGRQESEIVYSYRVFEKGGLYMDIVFRNSSNGYYGGWATVVDGLETTALDTDTDITDTSEWSA